MVNTEGTLDALLISRCFFLVCQQFPVTIFILLLGCLKKNLSKCACEDSAVKQDTDRHESEPISAIGLKYGCLTFWLV